MDAHHIPESIQWHEGLLLTPQHFQQMSLRQEALLQYVSAGLAPFSWGVRHYSIDEASLAGGTLRVDELEAVMPDCLVVSHDARRGERLQADLAPHAEQMKERPVAVHVAVAARETDALTRGDLPRYYSVDGEPVADESTGEGQLRIPRLRPKLALLVTNDPPAKYVSFPLAKVAYRDKSFALAEFAPPTLSLSHPRQSPLRDMCSAVAGRLRKKADTLADQLRKPTAGGRAGFSLETEHIIRSLVTRLPQLEAVLGTGVSHPYPVYLALCSVLGHVYAMGRDMIPPKLDPYDHNDLLTTFRQVLDLISHKIDQNVVSTHEVYPFNYEGGGVFSIPFKGAWAQRRLALGLRGAAGVSEQELAAWGRECVIGSESRMQWMRVTRILGARRELAERDGDFVPPRGVVLFALRPDPEFVEPEQPLQIFNTGERDRTGRPAEIVLYVGNAA